MAGVIDLTRGPGPSVQESSANISRVLDLAGQRERLRQDRQRINDFVGETIKLQGENPTMSPDLVARQAALNITQKDPEFDPGIVGLTQRFASGLTPGPSTALTGPIAEGILSEPTGINRERIREAIDASRAARTGKVGGFKPTPGDIQRDKDTAILNDTNLRKGETNSEGQKAAARDRLRKNPDLFRITASLDELDDEFAPIMKKLKDLRVQRGKFDKVFGKKAFDAGLKQAKENGLDDGVHEDSTEEEFGKWWDAQFEAEKDQTFQKFQDRAEFQDVEPETPPGDIDVKGLSDEALDKLIKARG